MRKAPNKLEIAAKRFHRLKDFLSVEKRPVSLTRSWTAHFTSKRRNPMELTSWGHSSDLNIRSVVERLRIPFTMETRRAALATNLTVASYAPGPDRRMRIESLSLAVPHTFGCPSPLEASKPNAFEIYPIFGKGADWFEFVHSVVIPRQVEMVRAVFHPDSVFMVIGKNPTLKTAILAHDWEEREPEDELFMLRENSVLPGCLRSEWFFAR